MQFHTKATNNMFIVTFKTFTIGRKNLGSKFNTKMKVSKKLKTYVKIYVNHLSINVEVDKISERTQKFGFSKIIMFQIFRMTVKINQVG